MSTSNEQIMISVVCITYNHEPYIRSALDGFVMQKTSFAFEVLVHDDASTDNTAEIIREYEQKYPNLIKGIYEKENQYSQGHDFIGTEIMPRIKGDYIAFCEGDDYWTDPLKLQKQFDALQAHPEVDICAHNAAWVRDGKTIGHTNRSKVDTLFDTSAVIIGGGGFVDTATLVFRCRIWENCPEFFDALPFLDYTMQILGSLRGGMLYLADCMSVTRVRVPGSWTVRVSQQDAYLGFLDLVDTMLDKLNEETQGKYAEAIETRRKAMQFERLERKGCFREMRRGEMRALYREKPMKWRLLSYIKQYTPAVYRVYQTLGRR